MMKQRQIAPIMEISEQYLSMLLKNQRPVSWPLAVRLAELFPGRTVQQWKVATPEQLKAAFEQLPEPEPESAA